LNQIVADPDVSLGQTVEQEVVAGTTLKRVGGAAKDVAALDKEVAAGIEVARKALEPQLQLGYQAAGDEPLAKQKVEPVALIPETQTANNPLSTFSLNVSDVSFKLAAASLEAGSLPEPGRIRTEEFINAFDYRDPEPAPGSPIAFAYERARYSFAHNRDLLRFSVKTGATGRQPGRPLNLVLLVDNSGSMERADRVRILREALNVLASQLRPEDKISVLTFSRTPRLWADGLSGSQAAEAAQRVTEITPEGGTNLEEALLAAYQTAARHYVANGINRVALLTDGAANLGNVQADHLKAIVERQRQAGVALDCFGVGWDGYNDDLLESLSRNGDGRCAFLNSVEQAPAISLRAWLERSKSRLPI
jgi:Mg-chelatase subunit ChlD